MEEIHDESTRRPLKSRGSPWSNLILKLLLKTSITPNQISLASIVFACIGALGFICFSCSQSILPLICAIFGMQGRLLCNLMDGMVAVEGGRSSKLGELYNEIPDRISDIVILLGAGYGYSAFSAFSYNTVTLAWCAALLAVLTAYVRMFGASVGGGQIFLGPMAKPHRMALLTAACATEILLLLFSNYLPLIPFALALVIFGCLITIYRRIAKVVTFLSAI